MGGRRGFTLIELLIAVIISVLVLMALHQTYTNLFEGYKTTTLSSESQIESEISTEVIRVDLEHVGYGISDDETRLPIEVSSAGDTLYIRSVVNLSRSGSSSWILVNCTSATTCNVVSNPDGLPLTTSFVFLKVDTSGGITRLTYQGESTYNAIGAVGVFVGLRYPDTTSGCALQKCYEIRYLLSNDTLATCNPNTRSLLRQVNDSTTGVPVLHCVSDWKVTFDLDLDGSNSIDPSERDRGFTDMDTNGDGTVTRSEMESVLKKINFYVLMHEGGRDRKFTFSGASSCSSGGGMCVNAGNVELSLPSDYANYKWRVIKVSVKPTNIGG